jgi:hypothetical protein
VADEDGKRRAWWVWAALAILAALAAAFAIQAWGRAMRPGGNDLTTYLTAAREFWRGANPYAIDSPFPFVYPLFLCVAIWPLAQLPYGVAVAVWCAIALAAMAGTTTVIAAMRGRPALPGSCRPPSSASRSPTCCRTIWSTARSIPSCSRCAQAAR